MITRPFLPDSILFGSFLAPSGPALQWSQPVRFLQWGLSFSRIFGCCCNLCRLLPLLPLPAVNQGPSWIADSRGVPVPSFVFHPVLSKRAVAVVCPAPSSPATTSLTVPGFFAARLVFEPTWPLFPVICCSYFSAWSSSTLRDYGAVQTKREPQGLHRGAADTFSLPSYPPLFFNYYSVPTSYISLDCGLISILVGHPSILMAWPHSH